MAVAELDGHPVILSGGDDGILRVWDLLDNRLARTAKPAFGWNRGRAVRCGGAGICSVAIRRSEERPVVISYSEDQRTLQLMEPSGPAMRVIELGSPVRSIALGPESTIVVATALGIVVLSMPGLVHT